MFVSIACDMGSEDSRAALYNLPPQYGFEKVQKADDAFMFYGLRAEAVDTEGLTFVHELSDIETLNARALEGTLAITTLKGNKWRRIIIRDPSRPRE